MVDNYTLDAKRFISDTQSVIIAAKRLSINLDREQSKIDFAAKQLKQAVELQSRSEEGYRAFMFSDLESTPESDRATRERITEDTLMTVLVSLETANLLIVAGAASKEAGEMADRSKLDEASRRLGNTVKIMERSQSVPLSRGAVPGRFGFQEESDGICRIVAQDLPSAIKSYRQRSDVTLSSLVSESKVATTYILTALSKLKPNDVTSALSSLGCQMQNLPQVGKLMGMGVKMIQDSIDVLIRLLGSESIAKVKGEVEEIWEKVKKGEYLENLLYMAFEIDKTKKMIDSKIRSETLDKNVLDKACEELKSLELKFKESMELMKGITSAVTFGSGVLAVLTFMTGPNAALAAAIAYLVIFAAIILLGMDYADSGHILQRIRGVGEITKGL
jgi:hypothetical protein